jgi:methionine-rich copper-binding protein CopC
MLLGFVSPVRRAGATGTSTGAPASALFHLSLLRSSPAKDTTLATAPTEVRLWFSQVPELATTQVKVTGPASAAVKIGKLTRGPSSDEALVIAPIVAPLGAGRYQVTWRTMSKDGHVVKGEFAFSVTPARVAGN